MPRGLPNRKPVFPRRRAGLRWAWIATWLVWIALPHATHAQTAEDELGNWLIFNSTSRFSEHWSLFLEGHVRLFEVASNLEELVGRATAQYHINPDALAAFGYVHAPLYSFEGDEKVRTENRIYQQMTLWQSWSRTRLEHRYRLEQRWLTRDDGTEYSNRFRYRIQSTSPLNRPALVRGAIFLNFYNEFFLNLDDPIVFDQNRLYGAAGYHFTDLTNLQLGIMWQARSTTDFFRLQMFYTHNFDFR